MTNRHTGHAAIWDTGWGAWRRLPLGWNRVGERVVKTVQTTAAVTDDDVLTVRVPTDLPLGEHEAVVVVDEAEDGERREFPRNLNVFELRARPADARLSRDEIYDDDGR